MISTETAHFRGIDIAVCHIATARTTMRTNAQTLLNDLTALVTFLGSEARVDSYHTMSSVLSFGSEDVEKRAPTCVHDTFSKVVVFHHVGDLKVLNDNPLIAFCVRFGCLKMVITALPIDLQMGLGNVLSRLTASVTALLTSTQLALFAS